jgi:aspartyl-tRNA(Asn)/glutamyl-tRNA(Gln) amidotransferase subunit C
MSVTVATISKLADLVRIRLSDQEKETLARDMQGILGFVDQLNRVNLDRLRPTTGDHGVDRLEWRSDVPESVPGAEAILDQAPQRADDFFVVPRMVGGE